MGMKIAYLVVYDYSDEVLGGHCIECILLAKQEFDRRSAGEQRHILAAKHGIVNHDDNGVVRT
jgi:hypothetical protein